MTRRDGPRGVREDDAEAARDKRGIPVANADCGWLRAGGSRPLRLRHILAKRKRRGHWPPTFKLEECDKWGCLRDKSEAKLCCQNGAAGVSTEMFAQPSAEYCALLGQVENLTEVSRELNNLCNFSSIGTSSDHVEEEKRGFRYRHLSGIPQVYHLGGRTYHRMFSRLSNALTESSVDFYFSHTNTPSAYINVLDVYWARDYMTENNGIAHRLAFAYDLRSADENVVVGIHPDDYPLSRSEAFSLHGSAASPWEPPRLGAVALEANWDDLHATSHVFIPEYSDLWETAQYPLIHPTGEGGFYSMFSTDRRGRRLTQRPFFVNPEGVQWSQCDSVAKYFKYLSYQYSPFLQSLRTLFQQFTLDQFSRWESLRFAGLERNRQVLESIRQRATNYQKATDERRRGREVASRPVMLPASVVGAPAHQKREVRNGLAVFARLGKPHFFITMTGNNNWPEFKAAVRQLLRASPIPGASDSVEEKDMTAENYPDVMARVFRVRLQGLEADLRSGRVFGLPMCYIQRVIEFQKRGMPHAHIALRIGPVEGARGALKRLSQRMVDSWATTRLFFHEQCPRWNLQQNQDFMRDNFDAIDDLYTVPNWANDAPREERWMLYLLNRSHEWQSRSDEKQGMECKCAAHKLGERVVKLMRHANCDSRCEKEINGARVCRRGYPKPTKLTEAYAGITYVDDRGYWHLKRDHSIDSRVVPYTPSLMLRYDCHINTEVCGSVKLINYLKKYMAKLPDSSRVSVRDVMNNPALELHQWQKLRHTGTVEAIFRMREIDLNSNSVGVTQLFTHLEGQHQVRWYAGATAREDTEARMEAAHTAESSLLRYFCRPDDPCFDDLLLEEYYSFYVVEKQRRRNANTRCFTDVGADYELPEKYVYRRGPGFLHVARIEQPSLRDNEELRALTAILRMQPARSFRDLRTFEGVEYENHVACAEAMGIDLGDDQHRQIMRETINPDVAAWRAFDRGEAERPFMTTMGSCVELRRMLVALMLAAGPDCSEGPALAEEFFDYLTLDLPHTGGFDPDAAPSGEEDLSDLKWKLLVQELSKLMFAEREDLSDYGFQDDIDDNFDLVQEEVAKHPKRRQNEILARCRIDAESNPEQQEVKDAIMREVAAWHGGGYATPIMIHGRPGRGKTYLMRNVIASLRKGGRVVTVTASSAKAALHYDGGITAHKGFGIKVPPEGEEHTRLESKYGPNHRNSKLVLASSLLVIDEITMLNRQTFEAIDAYLRQINNNNVPFGGMPIVCLGDFGQLPAVTKAPGRAATLANSPASSPLFEFFHQLQLSRPMRTRDDPAFAQFCDVLADGNNKDGSYTAQVPRDIPMTSSETKALNAYLTGSFEWTNVSWDDEEKYPEPLSLMETRLYKSAVLAYTNDIVNEYNDKIAEFVAEQLGFGPRHWYHSTAYHEVVGERSNNFATFDAMTTYHSPSAPAASLAMFPGMLMQLMRNFLPSQGLVNGAYVVPIEFTKNTVTVVNVTRGSAFYGQRDTLFRFQFRCHLKDVMEFNRRQFPLRPAYAGTVHRYQGDTIDTAGQLLIHASNCFAHGQLSVAFSRAQRAEQVRVVADREAVTKRVVVGVVFREFLSLAPTEGGGDGSYDSDEVDDDDGGGPLDEFEEEYEFYENEYEGGELF